MADLLECLLQIKGLGETVRRVEMRLARLSAAAPDAMRRQVAAELRRLLAAEERWQRFLRASLGTRALGVLPEGVIDVEGAASEDVRVLCATFARARLATLHLLDGASAADLSTAGALPGRGRTTVADAVALMLAEDTDRLGEMQRALDHAPGHPPQRREP